MSQRHNPFGPVSTAMVTPFNAELQVDYEALVQLAEYLTQHGTSSLVAVGTTGEAPTLSFDEKIKIFKCLSAHFQGRVPIIAGTGSYSTQETITLSQAAEAAGVSALLIVNPYYNKPSQEGLYQHFSKVADSVGIPVILYNHPGRTGVALGLETAVKLSKHPNIQAIKDSSGDFSFLSQLRIKAPDDFLILSGDDPLTLPILSLGGDGVVSVVSHIAGDAMNHLVSSFLAGDWHAALKTHQTLFDLMEGLFCAPSPSPTKSALNTLGLSAGGVRLPLTEVSTAQAEMLKTLVTTTLKQLEN